jgi:hypothetical protein
MLLPSARACAQLWIGTGYDGVDQRYYLVDTSLLTPDSLERLYLASSDVDEGELSVRTRMGGTLSWDQTTAITSLAWRHRTNLLAQSSRRGSTRGRAEYHVDWKTPHETGDANALSDYAIHELRLEGEQRVGAIWARLRGAGEWLYYPTPGQFSHDHQQYGGELRLRSGSDSGWQTALLGGIVRRHAPGAERVSYRELRGGFEISGNGGWCVGAALHFADRRYEIDPSLTDFLRGRVRLEWLNSRLAATWLGALEVEAYNYLDRASLVSDYIQVDLRQRRVFALSSSWRPFVEPGVEALWADSAQLGGDYVEPRVSIGAEFLHVTGWWANADLTARYRSYDQTLPGISNYWRFGASLLVDGPLWGRLTFNLLYAPDWEWHDNGTDDISVSLISASLRYRL